MDETQLQNIYQAYANGLMSPQEAADYEADVQSGRIGLPQGASVGSTPAPAAIDQGILNAYQSGQMTDEEAAEFETDLQAGAFSLPDGAKNIEQPGIISRAADVVTGELRETAATEALPDWGGMPELNSFSMSSFKSALGTMATDPEETVQVIKANFPGTEVRQDEKGNFIMRSSIDGQEYAIKPGFQLSDIPRAAGTMLAFTPAGGARTIAGQAAGAGLTQAGIEASQAVTGGEFDAEEVPTAAALGAAVPLAGRGVQSVASRVRGGTASAQQAARIEPTVTIPKQPVRQTSEELSVTARKATEAGLGRSSAVRTLAEEAAPDQKTVEAAQRLGIDEYLQPDHVTTNQAYRELAQAVKSVPGSAARAEEVKGLEQVAKRADDLIAEVGGTTDMSMLDASVKGRMSRIQSSLEDGANKLYEQLRDQINPKAAVSADNLVTFVRQRADDMGGEKFLSSMERSLLRKLAPESDPTYARLDDVRKALTAARVKRQGAFKDADSGLIKKLESELLKDQRAAAQGAGSLDLFNAARQSVAVRKGIEDDMTALFGRELQGSLIGDLTQAVKKLPAGDASRFIKLIKSVPEDMRQEVVASGLNTAFGKSAKNGQLSFTNFANWYDGLTSNKKAYNALMANLPKEARRQLSDLYRVSKGVSKAGKERIMTGRIQAVRDELRGADTLIGNIYDLAKRSSVGIAAEAVTTPLGVPGAGIASGIASALTKGKSDTLKAADALISSPEFIAMAKEGTEAQAKRLAKTPVFKKYMQALGKDRQPTSPEQWILSAFQARQQFNEE